MRVCACVLLVCACARASQEEDQVEARRAARVDSVGARPGREAERADRGEVGASTASVCVLDAAVASCVHSRAAIKAHPLYSIVTSELSTM